MKRDNTYAKQRNVGSGAYAVCISLVCTRAKYQTLLTGRESKHSTSSAKNTQKTLALKKVWKGKGGVSTHTTCTISYIGKALDVGLPARSSSSKSVLYYKVPLREVDTCLPGATQVE